MQRSRRVKFFELETKKLWEDKGTGHVSIKYVEKLKGVSLEVVSESDGSLLLQSKIELEKNYEKQQESLIVWDERNGFNLALSFEEKAICDCLWEEICSVQGKDPLADCDHDPDDTEEEICGAESPIELPPAELANLEEISDLVSYCFSNPLLKQMLFSCIENGVYIRKLLEIFNICEDLENKEGLHHLNKIIRNIFLLNKNALLDVLISKENIFDVVGCLEFESQSEHGHREYLQSLAKSHPVIPTTKTELFSKIHQTYCVQYIQDVILPTPPLFEERLLSTLSSFIYSKKVEIVILILEDEIFLAELFKELRNEKTAEDRRKELILFLKEFCRFSETLQCKTRTSFYQTMAKLGFWESLEVSLQSSTKETKEASVDILVMTVDFSPNLVRDYMMQNLKRTNKDGPLMNIIIGEMICDTCPGASVQLMDVIRNLLDPVNISQNVKCSENMDFLNHFYKYYMSFLITPLIYNTNSVEIADSGTIEVLGLVLDLLTHFIENHSLHMRTFIFQKDLLRRILILINSRHTSLRLSVVRFLRKIIEQKDWSYNRYIIRGNMFSPILDALVANRIRDNLLNSAIFSIFEFIKTENIKSLGTHIVENFSFTLDTITCLHTFKSLKIRYEKQPGSGELENGVDQKVSFKDEETSDIKHSIAATVCSVEKGEPSKLDVDASKRDLDVGEKVWLVDHSDYGEIETNVNFDNHLPLSKRLKTEG